MGITFTNPNDNLYKKRRWTLHEDGDKKPFYVKEIRCIEPETKMQDVLEEGKSSSDSDAWVRKRVVVEGKEYFDWRTGLPGVHLTLGRNGFFGKRRSNRYIYPSPDDLDGFRKFLGTIVQGMPETKVDRNVYS